MLQMKYALKNFKGGEVGKGIKHDFRYNDVNLKVL